MPQSAIKNLLCHQPSMWQVRKVEKAAFIVIEIEPGARLIDCL
jgi:hypothetical protein